VDHIYNDGDHTSGYDSDESERPRYHEMLQDAEGVNLMLSSLSMAHVLGGTRKSAFVGSSTLTTGTWSFILFAGAT